jgi:hypothetical protein
MPPPSPTPSFGWLLHLHIEQRPFKAGALPVSQYSDGRHFGAPKKGTKCSAREPGRQTPPSWLGIPILDSDSWDGQNLEFRFRVQYSGTFRRKIKSENLKTVQVENWNSGSYFSGIPEFR